MKFLIISALLILSAFADEHQQVYRNEVHKGIAENDEIYRHGITLQCDFGIVRHYWGEMYTCIARNLATYHYYDYVVNATGDHLTGKTDGDVEAVYILGQSTPFLPYNISTPFRGLRAIRVEDSGLKYLNRSMSYDGNLEYLHLENNKLETIPTWAVRGLTGLKWLSLRNNQIKYLESTLLRGMKNLRRFSVSSNLIEIVPSGMFHYTPELEEVYFYNNKIRMVGGRLVESLKKLKVAAFKGNKCTEISVYDGADIQKKMFDEFTTKCDVDCDKAQQAAQQNIKDLKQKLHDMKECGEKSDEAQRKSEYEGRNPRQPNMSSESSGN